MKILIALTYYQPHKSGLTVYAVRQARALAEMGHEVTVLTSQYERSLPQREFSDGVEVIRLPVAFRLSKGVIMPRMPLKAWQLIGDADMVNLHVPQMDAALIAILSRMRNKPVVLTYHCDLQMPAGWFNQLAGRMANLANRISATLADVVVHNTRDFAEHSPFLKRYLDKLTVIQPPIIGASVSASEIEDFRQKFAVNPGRRIIGMVARLATEKGVEYLVQAMPAVLESQPDAQVIFVGEFQHVFGEQAYREKLLPMIDALGDHWKFLGVVSERDKSAFYHVCDVLVLPSINSTESFGMVQIEALTCGTPVVATDLPGVRQPVLTSGLGEIVPVMDTPALAQVIIKVLNANGRVEPQNIMDIAEHYSPQSVAEAYDRLYRQLLGEHGQPETG
jgi:glycosyltransferase involved in cell wall biosynthesis